MPSVQELVIAKTGGGHMGLHYMILSFFFFLFRNTPAAYESSQARGLIGAAAASLHQSHSNAGSKPHLRP